MKINNKTLYTAGFILCASLLAACKNDLTDLNTNPETIYNISPEDAFVSGVYDLHDNDFDQYYDYRGSLLWMQHFVPIDGNKNEMISGSRGNTNTRYDRFYQKSGPYFTDALQSIKRMPEASREQYASMAAIINTVKIYNAFYVSDINGSIPYNEAMLGRYGGTTTPVYESQEVLFKQWLTELKAAYVTLEAGDSKQISLGTNDLYFKGDVNKWKHAINSLRLRIAFRLEKRDRALFEATANDVVAIADSPDESAGDYDWTFLAGSSFVVGGGNSDPRFAFAGSAATINFMNQYDDPRIGLFFKKNGYESQDILDRVAGIRKWPANPKPYDARDPRYIGGPASPDETARKPRLLETGVTVTFSENPKRVRRIDTLSLVQARLFNAASSEPNDAGSSKAPGKTSYPVINYADYCFMRAELAQKGIGNSTGAREWFVRGVKASIRSYDRMAREASMLEYTPVSDAETDAYVKSQGDQFDVASGDARLGLIYVQAHLNFFKQPNEAWALYKRTDWPNKAKYAALLTWDRITINNSPVIIPRRAILGGPSSSDKNDANKNKALADMAMEDGDFGTPSDPQGTGRIWWDKKTD